MNKDSSKKLEWMDIGPDWRELIVNINVTFMEGLAVIVSSALLAALVFMLLSTPGGIAGVFAEIMVQTCQRTGTCDFQTLYAGLGFGLVILTSFAAFTMKVIKDGVDRIGQDDVESPLEIPPYPKDQYDALLFIQSVGVVDSLSKLTTWIDAPYSTLYRWVQEFEEDGYVKIHSNGAGSPLRIECK